MNNSINDRSESAVFCGSSRDIKLTCDVAVIGAGPSGIAAAVTAAENGADVLLCEKNGCIGGMSTVGMLNTWCGQCESGFFERVCRDTTERRGRRRIYSPPKLVDFYIDALKTAGVRLLLGATLYDAETDADRVTVKAAKFISSGNTVSVEAKLYIDSTGNGDLLYIVGHEYMLGDADGLVQPMTLEFKVDGVDESRAVYPTFGTHPELEAKMREYVADGRIPGPAGHVILIEGTVEGTANVNMTNYAVPAKCDPCDPLVLTEAELTTRSQAAPILRFLRECVPGYENCEILEYGAHVGIRESRRFVGKHVLCGNDMSEGYDCEDCVAEDIRGRSAHDPKGDGPSKKPHSAKPFSIPFDCCLPKNGGNVWMNGRCISVTSTVLSAVRLMPVCFAIGEGLGARAAKIIRQ